MKLVTAEVLDTSLVLKFYENQSSKEKINIVVPRKVTGNYDR